MTAAGRQHGQKKEGKREAGGTESSFTFPSSADGRTFVPRLEGDGGDFQARLGAIPTRERAQVSPILSCGVIDSLIEASRIQPPRCTALLPSPSPRSPSCPSGERRPPRPDQIREGGAHNVGAVGRLRVRVQNSRAIGSKEQISAESF